MRLPRNLNLRNLSRNLRNNATKAERKLWYDFLRTYQPQWYRQRIVGNFILDFYCPKAHLAIEIDGGQRYENDKANQDEKRTYSLQGLGIKTIRFTNHDVIQSFDEVCLAVKDMVMQILDQELKQAYIPSPPLRGPSLKGGLKRIDCFKIDN